LEKKSIYSLVSLILDWNMDWNSGMDYGMDHFSIAIPGSAVWMFISFNGCILYIANSLPSTKETHLRSDRVKRDQRS